MRRNHQVRNDSVCSLPVTPEAASERPWSIVPSADCTAGKWVSLRKTKLGGKMLTGGVIQHSRIMECAEDPGWAKQKPNKNSKPNAFFEKCDLMVIYCVLETFLHIKSLHQDWSLYYSWTAKVQRGLVTCLGYTAGELWAKIQTQWDWVQHSCISGRDLEREGWRGCLYWAFGRFRKSQRCIIQENVGLVFVLWTWERLVLVRGIVLGI